LPQGSESHYNIQKKGKESGKRHEKDQAGVALSIGFTHRLMIATVIPESTGIKHIRGDYNEDKAVTEIHHSLGNLIKYACFNKIVHKSGKKSKLSE
jgi:hypothetical protein